MINQFRTLNPINIFFLVIMSILLRSGIFLHLPENLNFDFPGVLKSLSNGMPNDLFLSPVSNVIIAGLLVVIQALILNKVINSHNIFGKPTFLPALMYITVASIFIPFMVLNPVIISNFLVIWMINKFLSIYHRHEIGSVMYDLGMIVGVGTLIYFPFISMMPLLWISLVIFRPFNWREWIATLIGFITIYFCLGVFYFMNDSLGQFFQIWLPLANQFPKEFNVNGYHYTVLVPVIIIMVLSALSLSENFFRSAILVRKTIQLLFFMFILAMGSCYLLSKVELYHFSFGLAPASIFMAYYFYNAKKRWLYESLYALLLVFIIYFQIFLGL